MAVDLGGDAGIAVAKNALNGSRIRTRGVRKVIAEILPQIRGDSQLETACLNGQSGDQCFRSRFSFSSR